jgi:hypothetical protein
MSKYLNRMRKAEVVTPTPVEVAQTAQAPTNWRDLPPEAIHEADRAMHPVHKKNLNNSDRHKLAVAIACLDNGLEVPE